MSEIKTKDVFVTGYYPKYTFVDRQASGGGTLARRVMDALESQGMMVALVGPSKSGKSQLLTRALEGEKFKRISCSEIKTHDDLARLILDSLGRPTELSTQYAAGQGSSGTTRGRAGIGIAPFTAEVSSEGTNTTSDTRTTGEKRTSVSLASAVEACIATNTVIFLDNFHYLKRELLRPISQSLRTAIEDGMRCCIAYVPPKRDVVMAGNSDLNNKVVRIDLQSWKSEELCEIAQLGFNILKHPMRPEHYEKLAHEACFSPQLMQQLCYDLCMLNDLRTAADVDTPFYPDEEAFDRVLSRTVESVHFDTLFDQVLDGRMERQRGKSTFQFNNGTEGTFYTAFLMLLAMEPTTLNFSRPELQRRHRQLLSKIVNSGDKTTQLSMEQIERARSFFVERCQMWTLLNIAQALEESDAAALKTDTLDFVEVATWDQNRKELFVSDPSFIFQLRNYAKTKLRF